MRDYMLTALFRSKDGEVHKLGFAVLMVLDVEDVHEVFQSRIHKYDFENSAPKGVTPESFQSVLSCVPLVGDKINA